MGTHWTLRCRGPSGQATLTGVRPEMPVSDFLALIADKTGVPVGSQQVLVGFPPRPLQLSEAQAGEPLTSLGPALCNGETLTVTRVAPTTVTPAPPPAEQHEQVSDAPPAGRAAAAVDDEDEQLARAIAASLQEGPPAPAPPSSSAPQANGGRGAGSTLLGVRHPVADSDGAAGQAAAGQAAWGAGAAAVSVVALADGSCVVRRVVPSDNSCLFASVGYVMQGSRGAASGLRQVIARAVASDPDTYSEAFLGQPNAEYCRWIQDPQHWGGAIELSILCRHFGREIAAFDIQTCRCDVYGQDLGYPERVMLLYDGLHYDALAVSPQDGAPEEWDTTIQPSPAALAGLSLQEQQRAGEVEHAAKQLVESCHRARQFTDTANFTLRCGICQVGLKGEKEAVEHAKATGHQNFSEY